MIDLDALTDFRGREKGRWRRKGGRRAPFILN